MGDRWKKIAAPALGIAVLLVLWYAVCRAGIFSAYVLPPPAKVLNSFFRMLKTGELWQDVWISFLRVMKGFSIAFVLAFLLGMVRALLPSVRDITSMWSSFSATCRR